jgi:hypothetical protein
MGVVVEQYGVSKVDHHKRDFTIYRGRVKLTITP